MLFKIGETYHGSATGLIFDVLNFCSGAQVIGGGMDTYEVRINSYKMKFPEPVLALLLAAKVEPPKPEVVVLQVKPEEIKPEIKKEVKPIKKAIKSSKKGKSK